MSGAGSRWGRMSAGIELPGVLGEIEAVTGREAALAVALELGGRDIHVPSADYLAGHPDHPLARVLGAEAAARVAGQLRYGKIYVPRARRALTLHLAGTGLAPREIAGRLGVTTAAVRQNLRRA